MTQNALAPKMVLSIQSHVAYGHVGNSAAVFTLQRLGFEVLAVHTVQFSNHTGYDRFRGQVFPVEDLQEVILGMKENGFMAHVDAVLSGYMGDPKTGEVILQAVNAVRAFNPEALYLCDPVMGDIDRGVYVKDGIPAFMKEKAVPAASIISPNHFEFELLVDKKLESIQDAVTQARALMKRTSLSTVLVTSLATPDIEKGKLSTLAVTKENAWMVQTPLVDRTPMPTGTGDTFASIMLGRLLQGYAIDQALVLATSSLYSLVNHVPNGTRDLPLVAEQEEIVMPARAFDVVSVG